jgi:hypothetical protein
VSVARKRGGNKILNDERSTAYHEAGHAVIARVTGMLCGQASIKADEDSAGHSITHDPGVADAAWEKCGKYRYPDSVFRGRIMASMAGREAAIECLGHCQGGDGADRYQIGLMLEEIKIPGGDIDRYQSRLRAKTRGLVRRHRHKIEKVAEELLKRRVIQGPEIDAIIKRASSPQELAIKRRVQMSKERTYWRQVWGNPD